MSTTTFIVLFVCIQAFFVGLDLMDHRLGSREGEARPFPRLRSVIFFLTVIAVFFALQYGGLALVPGACELLQQSRGFFARWLDRPVPPETIGLPALVIVSTLGFYVAGLWDYLIHRFFSHHRWFFFTHEYHHLPSHVSVLMPGIAGRPFAVFAIFPTVAASVLTLYGLLAIFRLPLWDLSPLKALLLVLTFVQTASHSSCCRRWWWVHHTMKWLALTTPQEHVLHHTTDLRGNYGNVTTLWDRVFGTYLDPALKENQGHAIGLAYDQDFLGTLTLGRLKLPKRLRDRFEVGRFCNIVEREEAT